MANNKTLFQNISSLVHNGLMTETEAKKFRNRLDRRAQAQEQAARVLALVPKAQEFMTPGVQYSISDLVSIFILPPSTDELKKRLKRRAEDSDEIVENRMSKARSEISHWVEYDYVLINEDINKCLEKILVIIEAERSKRSRQKYIFDFVEKLI